MASVTPETPSPDSDLLATVEAADTTPPAPEPPHPKPAPKPRSRVFAAFLALVFGGMLAAGAGFALARLAPELVATPAAPDPQPDPQVETLRQQIAALPAPDPALPDRIAAIEAALAQLADRVAAVESRPAGAADPALSDQLQALQDRVAALGTGTAQPEAITAAVAAAEARLNQAEAKAADLAAQTEAAGIATRRAAAIDRIAAALDTGAPFAAVAADLPDLPPVLADNAATGLPSVTRLRETFPPAARAALESALRANMGESWTDRVSSFLRSQTGLRSLTPRQGDDPDAVLSRAEAALANGDVAAALTELETLPDAAKPPLADWIAAATLRTEGAAALARLAGAQ